ncbi:MAG: hypothetical protein HGA66_11035 [Holophaga sp.]|nr:hypothetical protein [Holophaga sp.]
MRPEFLGPGDPAWTSFLAEAPHDFYHLPGYVELCARRDGGEAAAFLAEEGGCAMLMPLVLRPVPGAGWRDACAPYGYPCPLFCGGPSPDQVGALLGAFAGAGAGEGLVSAFFRFHPLLPVPEGPFERFGSLVDHGQTVFLDLGLPPEELERQTRVNHRADARKLLAGGFRECAEIRRGCPEGTARPRACSQIPRNRLLVFKPVVPFPCRRESESIQAPLGGLAQSVILVALDDGCVFLLRFLQFTLRLVRLRQSIVCATGQQGVFTGAFVLEDVEIVVLGQVQAGLRRGSVGEHQADATQRLDVRGGQRGPQAGLRVFELVGDKTQLLHDVALGVGAGQHVRPHGHGDGRRCERIHHR